MDQKTTMQPIAKEWEMRIGKTLVTINSIYKGDKKLEHILFDWAVNKTLQTTKS